MRSKDNKHMEEAILKAAEVFLQKGYALVSTTEIARRAGCNLTMVHYNYRTKMMNISRKGESLMSTR